MLTGLLLIWLITATGLWLVTRLVSGIRARSAGSLLLAIVVFIFLQWFLFDTVFWLQMGPLHPRFGI